MKKIIALFIFVATYLASYGQCSTVAVQVSSSDTTYVQLYHAGFFNIPSGFANICEWDVTSFSGEIIHQETTSGGFDDQSRVFFNHSIPITDSMKVTIVITNNTEGITCTMNDTLYWKATEVLPGTFIGNWDVLNGTGGAEEQITSSADMNINALNIDLFPSPVNDYFLIEGSLNIYSFTIFNGNGQVVETYKDVYVSQQVDISNYASGIYFFQFWDKNNRNIAIKKVLKL